jgi:hypothetical protein
MQGVTIVDTPMMFDDNNNKILGVSSLRKEASQLVKHKK